MTKKIKMELMDGPLFKILNFFIENPYTESYLRQIARDLKISTFSAKKFLDFLLSEGIIIEEKKANLRYFKANISNLFFRHIKSTFNIKKILDSGLLNFLKENIHLLSSIILFGSYANGTNSENSDIDLLVIGKKDKVNISKYHGLLGKEISLFIFSQAEWKKESVKNKAFYQDVISHGIPLYGELPIL